MNLKLINIKESIPVNGKFYILTLLIPLITLQTSCKKFVEIPPPSGQITGDAVYKNNTTAIGVLTDLYGMMNGFTIQGSSSISFLAGLAADEYTLNGGFTGATLLGYYRNELTQAASIQTGAEHWEPLYNFIFRCNAAIEGLNQSTNLTPLVKQQLLGEAKFMRAFFFFLLVNMYGDVPLSITTDPEINTLLARSPKTVIYQQITNDLEEAENLLSDSYKDVTLLSTTTERTRPIKWAAKALLARVYLYSGEFTKAEAKASEVINNTSLYSILPDLNDVFLKNSREAIWQIQPTEPNFNTVEARNLIIPATGPSTGSLNTSFLSKNLLNSFESGDKRAIYGNWIDTAIYTLNATTWDTVAFPFKYKIDFSPNVNSINGLTEYFMVLRLAEQYLIRAEARAKQGNIGGAQSDLNVIRNRAGLANTTANDQASLLTAILNERRHELFSEWGHRWFDLKRTGKVDEIMTIATPIKSNGATQWQSYQQLYPLPLTELQRAPNLRQNPGY